MAQLLIGMVLFAELIAAGNGTMGSVPESELDLKKGIEELRQGQQAMRTDLMDIKSLLGRMAGPGVPQTDVKGMEFELGGNPVRGSGAAKLLLAEFTDYQCPHCGRYVRETFPLISERYIDTGLVQYAVYNRPLSIHRMAAKAAEASHCANAQGRFWEMHRLVMAQQGTLDDLSSYADVLDLDRAQFEDCLKSNKYREQVEKEEAVARKLGMTGVPGFVIAKVDPHNPAKAHAITSIKGAQPFSIFQKEIDRALTAPGD